MPYTVPEDYFTSTVSDLSRLIKDEAVPSALADLPRQVPYDVPAGYFDNLSTQILARVAPPKSKVVSLHARRWMRVAAAAVVVGLIAAGGIFYLNDRKTVNPTTQPEAWVTKKLRNVSKQALYEFINATDAEDAQTELVHNTELHNMLHDVSKKDLAAFLNTVPVDDEQPLNIN